MPDHTAVKRSRHLRQLRHKKAQVRDLNRRHNVSRVDLIRQNHRLIREGADPTICDLLMRMFNDMFEVEADGTPALCFLGPDGCTSHPGVDLNGECGYAWLRSWIEAVRSTAPAGRKAWVETKIAFVAMLNEHPGALVLIAEALNYWSEGQGPTVAGTTGPEGQHLRGKLRLARDLTHALRAPV